MIKERVKWVDIAKGFSILLVIVGHSIPHRGFFKLIWSIIFSFHMPLFFIISGFLFKSDEFKNLIRKNFKRMLIPYLITYTIYFIYMIITSNGKISIYLVSMLYGSGKQVPSIPTIQSIGALWFLVTLFLSNLIFNWILRNSFKKGTLVQFIYIIFACIIGYLLKNIEYLPWSLDLALISQVFLYTGYKLKNFKLFNGSKIPISSILILICLWLICINNYAFDLNQRVYRDFTITLVGSISGSIMIFYLSSYISKIPILNNFLTFCGRESLIILCIHFLEYRIIPWNYIFKFITLEQAKTKNLICLNLSKLTLILLVTLIIKKAISTKKKI